MFSWKKGIQKRFLFIGRSLVWSLLLYIVMMLVFNWDDVRNTIRGTNAVTVMNNTSLPGIPQTNEPSAFPASITHHTSPLKNIFIVLKEISGIAGKVTRAVNSY
jgi:hypothetical protein